MSSFTQFNAELSVELLPQTRTSLWQKLFGQPEYKVTKTFQYYVNKKDENLYVAVPQGFVTDLATIPWAIRWLLPPNGKYGQAAVVHDYLTDGCAITKVTAHGVVNVYPTRAEADKIFLQAMVVLRVPKLTRLTMYYAVRLYSMIVRKDRIVAKDPKLFILTDPTV